MTYLLFFFFQAEDGIRDGHVTGVQTCALPICTKTELKNLRSFAFVRNGLEFEEKRQEEVLLSGEEILQETRRYDESTRETILMRVKDDADDYRLFPEPDLVPLHIDDAWKERVLSEIPELPEIG